MLCRNLCHFDVHHLGKVGRLTALVNSFSRERELSADVLRAMAGNMYIAETFFSSIETLTQRLAVCLSG